MVRLNRMTIRELLKILMIITISAMLLFQGCIYIVTQINVHNSEIIYEKKQVVQVKNQLIEFNKQLLEAAVAMSYEETTQKALVSDSPIVWMESSQSLRMIQTYTRIMNKNVVGSKIIGVSGTNISSYNSDNYSESSRVESSYTYLSNDFKERMNTPIYIENDYKYYFSLLYPIYYAYVPITDDSILEGLKLSDKIGVCIFMCNTDYMTSLVKQTSISNRAIFLIVDDKMQVVASNKDYNQGSILDIGLDINKTEENNKELIKYNGKESILQWANVPDMNWKVISIIPRYTMYQGIQKFEFFSIIFVLSVIILLVFIYKLIDKSITLPVTELNAFLKSVGNGETDTRLTMKYRNEIAELSNSINSMLDNIKKINKKVFDTQTRLYEAELSQKESELIMLQSQINPHFLYNTLECLRSIGMVKKVDEVVKISTSLSKILRYSVKGEKYVFVKTEISYIEDYLSIINIRFRGKYDCKIIIDAEIMEYKMPKMILQPIIENAFYHGLGQILENGKLTITGEIIDSKELLFKVIDNGIGIMSQKLEEINRAIECSKDEKLLLLGSSDQLGIINIDRRIRLIYGSNYGLEVESELNKGTTVIIRLPIVKEEH